MEKAQKKATLAAGMVLAGLLAMGLADTAQRRAPLPREDAPLSADRAFYLIENGNCVVWGGDAGFSYDQREVIFEGAEAVWNGFYHALVLDGDGNLWTNGGSGYEDPTRKGDWELVLDQVAFARAGVWNNIGVREDGSLWIWGHNDQGQLGNGEKSHSPTNYPPVKVLDYVVSAGIDDTTTLAVTETGGLYGLGPWNDWEKPLRLADGVRAIAKTHWGWQALLEDGRLAQLTITETETGNVDCVVKPLGISGVTQIFDCAYRAADGQVLTWNFTTGDSMAEAETVSLGDNVRACACGADGFLVLTEEGELRRAKLEERGLRWVSL
jgi:hypothetical protein